MVYHLMLIFHLIQKKKKKCSFFIKQLLYIIFLHVLVIFILIIYLILLPVQLLSTISIGHAL